MLKTIKGVDSRTWKRFRDIAMREELSMGATLKKIVEKYMDDAENAWNSILSGSAIISKKEADELRNASAEFRKTVDFRE